MTTDPAFSRLALLAGPDATARLAESRVIVFGVGGVGSWCAEGLARSGVGHLTLVDSDQVCITNVNRQLGALRSTVGSSKVGVLARRFADINPVAEIVERQEIYDSSTADTFDLSSYDCVVDAIDSLSPKVELAIRTQAAQTPLFSSLGASNRLDPCKVRVASIWKTEKCRLGHFVRKKLRERHFDGDYQCVYSAETATEPFEGVTGCGTGNCLCPKGNDAGGEAPHEWCSSKARINGSAVHMTATYGFFLTGIAVNYLMGNPVIQRVKMRQTRPQ